MSIERLDEDLIEPQSSDLEEVERETEKAFMVYPYRYVNVCVYILGMLQISLMQNSFAPQAAELKQVYGLSNLTYNLTSLVHMIVHVPVSFPANYIVDKYGTKVGNTIACFFSLAACWVRCLVNSSFNYAIMGQVFVGCANPFIINAISKGYVYVKIWLDKGEHDVIIVNKKVSSNWFYPSQRGSVTGILSFFSTVTGVVGLLLPGFYFSGYVASEDTSVNYQNGRDKTFYLLLITAIMVSCTSLINLLFYKDKPATPPSFSAALEREDFRKSLSILISNRSYVLISLCFSLMYGCFIDFAVVLGQLIEPYGFESSSTSGLSALSVAAGIAGSVIILQNLKQSLAYKKLISVGIVGSFISIILMIALLNTEAFLLVMIPAMTLGFFIIPIIPMLLEFANEVTFPIGEATVTGFIYTLAHIVSFLLGSLFSIIIDAAPSNNKKSGTIWVLVCICSIFMISLVLVFFMKQDLKRTNEELKRVKIHRNSVLNPKEFNYQSLSSD